jgi:mxaA protein
MTRFACGIIALSFSVATIAAAASTTIAPIVTLRDTGYMLGDLIDENIALPLTDAQRIDPDSLPPPGRVAPWLEVRRAALGARDASGVQAIVVTYQIFAESEQAARAPIPGFTLRVRENGDVKTVAIPEQSFLLSPALPVPLTDQDRELRPSPAPTLLAQRIPLLEMAASLALALACGFYLLWCHDLLPFLPHSPGPFVRTWRRWRRVRADALGDQARATLLRDLHGALNKSAGETLYPSTLARLFVRAPHLVPLRERIEHMFEESWKTFYETPVQTPLSTTAVLGLLRDAADRERGVPC